MKERYEIHCNTYALLERGRDGDVIEVYEDIYDYNPKPLGSFTAAPGEGDNALKVLRAAVDESHRERC